MTWRNERRSDNNNGGSKMERKRQSRLKFDSLLQQRCPVVRRPPLLLPLYHRSSSGSGGGRPQNAISSGTKVHRCVPLLDAPTMSNASLFSEEDCLSPFLFRDRDIILGYLGDIKEGDRGTVIFIFLRQISEWM